MPVTLQDMLQGDPRAVLTLHLADAPLVEPYSLETLQEPTWEGYTPPELELSQQAGDSSGWSWIEGTGGFAYLAHAPPPVVTGMFVVASFQGSRYLICVIDLAETEFRQLEQGQNTFNVRINAYAETKG